MDNYLLTKLHALRLGILGDKEIIRTHIYRSYELKCREYCDPSATKKH